MQRARGNSYDFWRSEEALHVLDDRARQLLADVGLSAYVDAGGGPSCRAAASARLEIATTLALDPR